MIIRNIDGDMESIKATRLLSVLESTQPAVISVLSRFGDELVITDICIDVRQNGIHILLETPEAVKYDEDDEA